MSALRHAWWMVAVWLVASSASAQVEQGAFKLSLDTELFGYDSLVWEDGDYETKTTEVSFGPGRLDVFGALPAVVGFGVGYVAHPHVIPQLAFSFGFSSYSETSKFMGEEEDEDSEESPKISSFMLQPRVEIPFNPASRTVLSALLGFDVRQWKFKVEDGEYTQTEKLIGYGPVLGFSAHFFLTDTVSLDFTPLVQINFLKDKSELEGPGVSEGEEDDEGDPDTYRQTTFGILVGLSAWPGVK